MNQENLIGHSFADKPGNRNKAGRPKRIPKLDELLTDVLLSKTEDGRTKARAIIDGLADRAINGDVRCAKVLFEYAYGLPKQTFVIENPEKLEQKKTVIVFSDDTLRDERGNVISRPDDPDYYDLKLRSIGVEPNEGGTMNGYAGRMRFGENTVRDADGNITRLPPELEQWESQKKK